MGKLQLKGEALAEIARKLGDRVRCNEPMSLHTSFHIGGPADLYAVAVSARELVELVSLAQKHDIAYLIIGRATNILVADKGIRGLVIESGGQETCFADDVVLYAESGALLENLARESAERGLDGLAWAVGIPGSVGGAIVGNAGAYGGYISDVIRKVTVLTADGTVQELSAREMGFGYRTSRFKGQGARGKRSSSRRSSRCIRNPLRRSRNGWPITRGGGRKASPRSPARAASSNGRSSTRLASSLSRRA